MLLPVEVKFAYGMAAASEQCYALAERVSGLLCDSDDMRVAVYRRINFDRAPSGERAWESHFESLGCHLLQRSAGPEGRGVQHFGRRTDVTTENPARHPCRRPTHWEISNWQKHEAGARKFPGGRVSDGTANQVSSVRRIAHVSHEGASIVDGALTDVAKGLRMGGRDDQATSLGQGNDADESGKPGH